MIQRAMSLIVHFVFFWICVTAKLPIVFAHAADDDNPFATEQEKRAAAKPRTWSDRNGKFSVEAKLVKIEDGKVVLRRTDNQEITVPLEKLSDADQKFLATLRGKSNTASGEKSTAPPETASGSSTESNSAAAKINLVATDYHQAKIVDLSGTDSWKYKPDLASATEKLPAARVSLKAVEFFDQPQRILLVPNEKKAFVVFYNSFKTHTCQVQACNLQSGEMEAAAAFAQDEVPLDISPDGALVLAKLEGNEKAQKSELHLYTRDGRKVKPLKGWRPYVVTPAKEGDDFDTEVKWAAFTDAQHVFTLSTFGKLVLWEVPGLKPIWATTLAFTSEPSFSAGRQQVAIVSKPEVNRTGANMGQPIGGKPADLKFTAAISILNVADGAEVAHLALDEDPGMCSVALRDDGARLALGQSGRIRVWDLQSKEVVRDFALQHGEQPMMPGRLAWTAPNYLLTQHGVLVDVERRIPIWHYNNMHEASAVRDGKVWFLDTGLSHEARVLVGAALPNQAALDAVKSLKPEDLLVVHPGMEVALDCQLSGDAPDVAAAKQALEERLQKNGMKLAADSKNRLIATIQPGKTVTVRYHSWRTPLSASQEHQVATQVLNLSFQVDGKTVWKYEASTSPPAMLHLQEGENVDQALQRVMNQQEDYFPKRCTTIWIPAYIAQLPGDNAEKAAPQRGPRPSAKSARPRDA